MEETVSTMFKRKFSSIRRTVLSTFRILYLIFRATIESTEGILIYCSWNILKSQYFYLLAQTKNEDDQTLPSFVKLADESVMASSSSVYLLLTGGDRFVCSIS